MVLPRVTENNRDIEGAALCVSWSNETRPAVGEVLSLALKEGRMGVLGVC